MSDVWYYVDDGAQVGPAPFDNLRNFLLSPRGGKRVLVWRKGLGDWKAAGEIAELNNIFDAPPPIPSRALAIPKAVPLERTTSTIQASAEVPADRPSEKSFAKKALGIFASIAGAALGFAVVKNFGGFTLWPAFLIGISWMILAKCRVEKSAIPMMAFLFGHTGWMIVGHVSLYFLNKYSPEHLWVLIDVGIVAALGVWFFMSPSRAAAIAVLVYQIAALILGVAQFGNIYVSGDLTTLALAQVVHVVLRMAGIIAALFAVVKLKPQARVQPG